MSLPQQGIPIVGWVACLKALYENGIGIAKRTSFPKRGFVIDPRVDDGFVGTAEPEEKPESA